MNKGERISKFVRELEGDNVDLGGEVANHPFYRAYFRCWNEQRYYEAHDVLEQLWLNNDTADDNFFKGLIQAAAALLQRGFDAVNLGGGMQAWVAAGLPVVADGGAPGEVI